jgi:hypothetical protein
MQATTLHQGEPMTITELPITAVLTPVAEDLYRDIHKAIRAELFSVTSEAGRLDPSQGLARAALSSHVSDVVDLLVSHAEHEDAAIQPTLEAELPDLAERVEVDHLTLEAAMDDLKAMAQDAASLTTVDPGAKIHRIYLALASFTSDYLDHQDIEERVIMPALEAAAGVDARHPCSHHRVDPPRRDGAQPGAHDPRHERRQPGRAPCRHAGGRAGRGVRGRVGADRVRPRAR